MSELNLQFINPKILGKPESIEKILEVFCLNDFEISALMVGTWLNRIAFWHDFSQKVLDEIGIVYDKGLLSFISLEKIANGVGISLTVSIQFNTLTSEKRNNMITAWSQYTSMYRQEEYGATERANTLLTLTKALYEATQPEFGWIEICKASGYTKQEDIEALEIPFIYWANFFGPRYVAKYGKEYFKNAPGWKVEFLSDGGCMYVLAPTLKQTPKALANQVKNYFGVEFARNKPKKIS